MTERVSCPWLELDGRLGNSLFQIASTLGVARSLGAEPAFPLWSYQHVYQVPEEWFWPRDTVPGRPVDELVPHLHGRAARYLQDPALFADVADEVRDVFKLQPWARNVVNHEWWDLTRLVSGPFVAVHVRRGDNVTNDPGTINCLPESYYRDGLTAIYRRVGGPKAFPTTVVFSDDPDWCEEVGLGAVVYRGTPRPKEDEDGYWSKPVDWIDLAMMAAHPTYHVLSNSTYAWWAAWMSGDPSPVYPGYWFGAQIRAMGIDPALLFPPEWERVDVADPNPQPIAPGTRVRVTCGTLEGKVLAVGWDHGYGYADVEWENPDSIVNTHQPLDNLTRLDCDGVGA